MDHSYWLRLQKLRSECPWRLPPYSRKSEVTRRLLLSVCHPTRVRLFKKKRKNSLPTIYENSEDEWILVSRFRTWKAATIFYFPGGTKIKKKASSV